MLTKKGELSMFDSAILLVPEAGLSCVSFLMPRNTLKW